jgi:cell division protein FtsQ
MAAKKPHKRGVGSAGSTSQLSLGTAQKRPKMALSFGRKSASEGRASAAASRRRVTFKGLAIGLAVLFALSLAGAIGIVVLSHTDAFTIASIDAESTEHVSSTDIASLAGVTAGTTLLNYDEATIVSNLKRNPWIADVSISRVFPDRLRISVTERTIGAYVMMNSGSVIWCLGNDDVWIEPVKIPVAEGQSIVETALAVAMERNALLISDVPQTVSPVEGGPADDEVFVAIRSYRDELSPDLWNQIVSINASSVEGISCLLKSGVELSLGAPTSIQAKETVIEQLMAKYPNRLTYINVRVPANPSYRMVDSESVEGGTGAIGDVVQSTGTSAAPEETGDEAQG